jgi:hypothetical protein
MDLKSYFYSLPPDERERFALEAGTTLGHLRNCAYGKPVSPALAVSIERLSNRKVTRRELRADWLQIWPELDRRGKGR